MAKHLNCADIGFDCSAQFEGETEDEIMSQAAAHAMSAHGMSESELQEHEGAIRGAIRDV